jgi:acyl-CoA synthetase (AMP-forming)/AMP-acid ligase II
VKNKRQSLYYLFEDSVKRRGNEDCIWSREGEYSWNQTYAMVHRYAQWYLSLGVKPHDYVGFYLQNSPDFIFAWLGLWCIGAAPAMINYNLSGKALQHCLKISDAQILIVDDVADLRARIDDERGTLESEFGMKIILLDEAQKAEIHAREPKRPEDLYRDGVQGNWPMSLFYTR